MPSNNSSQKTKRAKPNRPSVFFDPHNPCLIEQNARAALQLADRAYVLEMGAVALSGPAGALLRDGRIIDSYLGLGGKRDASRPA
jgi:hypothetical protein